MSTDNQLVHLLSEVSSLRASLAVAEEALIRLRDCDWVITPHDRMNAVREIAKEALSDMSIKSSSGGNRCPITNKLN